MKHHSLPADTWMVKLSQGLLCGVCALWLLALVGGCDMGTPTSQISGVLQSAEPLPEYDENGRYTPYYKSVDMKTPRYLHEGFTHSTGYVVAIGGSDERGLSALDTMELYDQSILDPDEPPVDTVTGIWLDTDFEGEPIILINGPRLYFSATELESNQIIAVGGSTNVGAGAVYDGAEMFDFETRRFSNVENNLEQPRFRHDATVLPSGDLLISGGQILTTVTVIDEEIPEGQPGRERQEQRFPSTEHVEYFSPTDQTFYTLRLQDNSNRVSVLQTRRGRSGHTLGRLAGPDDRLGGGDDLYIATAGFQTLSAVSGLAPQVKRPGAVGRGEADAQTSVEIFDPSTNIFTLLASVKLDKPRVNDPYLVNLGEFNGFTPDGVLGMANALLVTHGNSDASCPTTPLGDKIIIADYTPGAGPGGGIRFYEVVEEQYFSLYQNTEYQGLIIPPDGQRLGPLGGGRFMHQRCATNPVSMPRPLQTVLGVPDQSIWVYSLAGVDIFPTPAGCAYNSTSTYMLAGGVFEPFYNLRQALNNGIDPLDLVNERRVHPQNYLGILGFWFTIDGQLSKSLADIGTTPENRWPTNAGRSRVYGICSPIGGVDGVVGTFDDRILLFGGGQAYASDGGEPTSPSTEVFLQPGSDDFN